jgi:hypothetical protein
MFMVLRLRLKRKVKTGNFAKRVVPQEPWDRVISDFCAQIMSTSDFKEEEFKDKLISLVQIELFFRTTTWLEFSDLVNLEDRTTSLEQFAKELVRIDRDIQDGKSPFTTRYHYML